MEQSLIGKKILLIGCGTIGGYIASLLSKNGAGAGENGILILLDKDILSSGNLGRHILGMNYLHRNKVDALKDQLLLDFNHLNICPIKADFRDINVPWDVDLIVDATGEEAISVLLNHEINERRKAELDTPPIIYSWIKGPGLAVQSFFDDGSGACFQCLRVRNEKGQYSDLFPLLKKEDEDYLVTDRCNSTYAPFSVFTSTYAASLTIEMIMSWNSNNLQKRFRTIRIDQNKTIPISDCNPKKRSNCDECGKNTTTE